MRLAPSTSLTSLIERSWPTASGVNVSGKVTVSRSGRTGSASGSGSFARIAFSASSESTTSSTGLFSISAASRRSALVPSDRDPAGGLGRVAQRQLHPKAPALIGRLGALCVDVDLQLDDPPERTRGNLALLVDPPLGLLHRPLPHDRQLPPAHLDAYVGKLDPGEIDLDNGHLRFSAVVDVHVRREPPAPLADVGGPCPRIEVPLRHGQNITRPLPGGLGAQAVWEAQRGGRISSTGWRGGTRPSGRLGRNVVQGSSSSSAQSRF